MKTKILFLIIVLSLILISGCITTSKINPNKKQYSVTYEYTDCNTYWWYGIKNHSEEIKEVLGDIVFVDSIEGITYVVDKEMLIKISKSENKPIICGKGPIINSYSYLEEYDHLKTFDFDEWEYRMKNIFRFYEGITSTKIRESCDLNYSEWVERDYDQTVEHNDYFVYCCADKYCYKIIETKDYYLIGGCYLKAVDCEELK